MMPQPKPDDSARTWRDLADQLTAEEAALLNRLENAGRSETDSPTAAERRRRGLLALARGVITDGLLQSLYADVPAPPEATVLERWVLFNGVPQRDFDVINRDLGDDTRVSIVGTQFTDGEVVRFIEIARHDDMIARLNAAQAHAIADALRDAADTIERLNAAKAGS